MAGRADGAAAVGERIGRPFVRPEPGRRAAGHVRGLLRDAERKNGWQRAEHLGDPTPDGAQHLPARAGWDADPVRDDLTAHVADHLGDPGGVPVADETGLLEKGTTSCRAARRYSGTAGRIENRQVGVLLGCVTPKGRALLGRELYLPKERAADADRREEAGVPDGVASATRPVPARRMVERAVAAGVPARRVTADAVYGSDYHFRTARESLGLGYVAGVRSDFAACVGWRQGRAKARPAEVPANGRRRVSCGAGAKGPRAYDRALIPTNGPRPREYGRRRRIRRGVSDPGEVADLAGGGPPGTTLDELVRVAGTRWAIEECFERAKGECGPDECEVRSGTGWHRHVTLGLFALSAVAVIRSRVPAPRRRKRGARGGSG